MNTEQQIADKVTAYLDQGAANLRAGTVYRLQQARAAALARLDPAYTEASALQPAFAGGQARRSGGREWLAHPVRWLGLAIILAAGLFAWQQWHAVQQVRELQDLDAQILSSDLPIDAYLDRGFANWLKTDAAR